MRNFRFYFIFGSVALIAQLLLAVWSYRIVSNYRESLSAVFKQHQLLPKSVSTKRNDDRLPDGTFNGFPVYYHDLTLNKTYHSRPYSSVRCVGENYQGDNFAWMHRSCHFRFLCFNVSSREFEVYARPDDETLGSIASRGRPFMDFSASVIPPQFRSKINGVSLGSGTVRHPVHNNDHDDYGRNRSRLVQETHDWFPTVVRSSPPERYYALEEDFVFVPFHSAFAQNGTIGDKDYSVVWDDLFPIYTLLSMFQLTSLEARKEAFLMRVDGDMKNFTNDHKSNLQRRMDRFRPLMTRYARDDDGTHVLNKRRRTTNWTSQADAILMSSVVPSMLPSAHTNMLPLQSGLVCAKDAVAGLGPHGIRGIRWMNRKISIKVFQNQGKGSLVWMFRNYCIDNLGLLTSLLSPPQDRSEIRDVSNTNSTIRILLSAPSSDGNSSSGDSSHREMKNEVFDFTPIERGLRDFLSLSMKQRGEDQKSENIVIGSNTNRRSPTTNSQTEIESHDFSNDDFGIVSRIKLMLNTAVFIATCSDATATAAIFLPQGATFVAFYSTEEDSDSMTTGDVSESTSASVCVDYRDLLNNLSHVVVHWLPMSTLYSEKGRKALYDVVEHATRVYKRRNNLQ